MNLHLKLGVSVFWLLTVAALPAAEQKDAAAAAEARMREALRAATLQLREAQNQVVSLQAEKAQLETEKTELKTQTESLNKQIDKQIAEAKADKAAADKSIAGLNGKVEERDKRISKLNEVLEKWKEAYNQAVIFGKGKEYERAKLQVDKANLERLVADRESRNLELFKIGSEVLKRYEKFSLGEALTAREPFVGTTKVKMQTLVQDYADKLVDQKLTVEEMSKPSGDRAPASPPEMVPGGSSSPGKQETEKTVPESTPKPTPTEGQDSATLSSAAPVIESLDQAQN